LSEVRAHSALTHYFIACGNILALNSASIYNLTLMPQDPAFLNDTGTSWAESIKQYENSKKTLSWRKEDILPVQKLSAFERASKQREVDPLSMTFRDLKREAERVRLRTAKDDAKCKSYFDARATQRNILTNTSNDFQNKHNETLRQSVAPPPPRERNLISHLQNGPDHIYCPTLYDEQYMTQKVHVRTRQATAESETDPRIKDFDILSNK
jgi:hypothetical protein